MTPVAYCGSPKIRRRGALDEYSVSVRGSSLRLQYGVEDLPLGLEAQAHYSVEEEAIVVVLTELTYED
jgi:hypothetical protein